MIATKRTQKEVHISSLLVYAHPAKLTKLTKMIEENPNMEIAQSSPVGKMIIVMEAHSLKEITTCIDNISGIDGVFSVILVYHQVEHAGSIDMPIDGKGTTEQCEILEGEVA